MTAVCQRLPGGRLEASFESPHVPFPLTTQADNLEDVELVVCEIVSALATVHASAVTVTVVLDVDGPWVAR